MMQRHIARLENYVNTMNTLQRLEDIELHRKAVDKTCLYRQLKETGACICTDKTFLFEEKQQCQNEPVQLTLDVSVILQVYEKSGCSMPCAMHRDKSRHLFVSLTAFTNHSVLTMAEVF